MCSEICFLSFQNRDFLRKTSPSLLIQFLHKIFNMENMPWVHLIWRSYNNFTAQAANISSSFWWRDILKRCSNLKNIASCSIASGDTALILSNKWTTSLLTTKFPRPCSFFWQVSLSEEYPRAGWPHWCFWSPFVHPSFWELLGIESPCDPNQTHREFRSEGSMVYSWGAHFSTSKIYKLNFEHIGPPFSLIEYGNQNAHPRSNPFLAYR
jgi:hypothetical protein